MHRKITSLFSQHFKLIIALNLVVTLFFTVVFWLKGYNHYPLYMLAITLKVIGYGISVGIEKLLFQARSYHYRNLGFSYRMLFGWLLGADFIFFILFLTLSSICKSFI